MAIPNATIIIARNGDSIIVGMERSKATVKAIRRFRKLHRDRKPGKAQDQGQYISYLRNDGGLP